MFKKILDKNFKNFMIVLFVTPLGLIILKMTTARNR